MRRWLPLALLLGAVGSGMHASEIGLTHINDLFSASPVEDDLYTATLGLHGTTSGWTLEFEELMFTDKAAGIRFDESYLTVARELVRSESNWRLRAEAGLSHVGRGLLGQDAQNFVHRIFGQSEVNLAYVSTDRTYGFVRVDASRVYRPLERVTLLPRAQIESSGFKQHALLALDTRWELGSGFELRAEGGWRLTDSDFGPLEIWIVESEPTVTIGVRYRHHVELAWTSNYFGTSDNHWHVGLRMRLGNETE